MLKAPSSVSDKRNSPVMKVSKQDNNEVEIAKTAPDTPEEDNGVTVFAHEIDPAKELLSPLILQQVPSPLRGDNVPDFAKTSAVKGEDKEEEKKEEDPSDPADQTEVDVVSKTLHFFEDFCTLPQMPQITSDSGEQAELLPDTATYDDNTTTPSQSLPSVTTGNTSFDPSTRDPSTRDPSTRDLSTLDPSTRVPSTRDPPGNLGSSAATAHDHENFEVVLDPLSTKEERKNVKEQRGNRWNRISKSLATSLSSQKKEKNQSMVGDKQTDKEIDEAPLDEEIGRLVGVTESEEQNPDHSKEAKTSTSVAGPKVLAKKIWKSCKKIPNALHKGEQTHQPHRAEVDNEAAVARSFEEQEFLQKGSPKDGVEPILEESGNVDNNKVLNNHKGQQAHMAKNWGTILEEQRRLRNEGQSVEASSSNANNGSQRRRSSLSRRLKKIQKSAYFMSSKKGTKKNAKAESKANPISSVATPASLNSDKSLASNSELQKPKLIWKSVVDPNSGRTYYYHRKTRETTWTKPDALKQYEVDYKKWLDATALRTNESALNDTNKEVASKEENTLNSINRTISDSKRVRSNDSGKNGKGESADVQLSENSSMIPIQMSDSPVKEATKQDSNTKQKDATAESVSREKVAEKGGEMNTEMEEIKQPFDESKPFDEATPFDEPLADSGPGLLFLPRSPARFGRTMTYMSKASARSALTDRTEKVRNTGKGKFSSINPINENSSSSFHDSYRVPSRVPVHRERQLMVEELTDARLSAESYEGNAGERRGRIVRGRAREVEPTPAAQYDADNENTDDYGTSGYDNDTYGTDSVSALSENDTDFLSRRDNFDQARKRALDAAIEIEDWDLAAALSDGMRAVNLPGGYEKAHSSWNQSELDKFIANNDWSAVKSYIAKMREQSKKEQGNEVSSKKGQASPANKRVGSRSQIQHRDVMSESSWSGSESQSSYETYDSESEI